MVVSTFLFLPLIMGTLPSPSNAFAPRFQTSPSPRSSSGTLWAKKASKQRTKKPSATSSGGFASAPATAAASNKGSKDDYAVFPALEPQVKETLVCSEHDINQDVAGELPNEIYQRLGQIYGFPSFNYETTVADIKDDDATTAPMSSFSMTDLISGNLEEDEEDEASSNDDDDALDRAISQLPPFTKFHVLHVDPLVLSVENFFTPEECDAYVDMPLRKPKDVFETGSMTVGKDAKSKSQRTSTTWFNHYKNVPALMAKASRLLGLDGIDQWEEPQTVRYVVIFCY